MTMLTYGESRTPEARPRSHLLGDSGERELLLDQLEKLRRQCPTPGGLSDRHLSKEGEYARQVNSCRLFRRATPRRKDFNSRGTVPPTDGSSTDEPVRGSRD